jgi:hypothetical protein
MPTASSLRVTQVTDTVTQHVQTVNMYKPYHSAIDIFITCGILSLVTLIYKESYDPTLNTLITVRYGLHASQHTNKSLRIALDFRTKCMCADVISRVTSYSI